MASQSNRNLTIESLSSSSRTKGFFVQSTAPINVEDKPTPINQTFDDIKADAIQVLLESEDPQINIYVHGYSVKHDQAKARARKLFQSAQSHQHSGQLVFGFLWPSENPVQDNRQSTETPPIEPPKSVVQKIGYALESLPTVLLIALCSSLILGLISWGLLLFPLLPLSWINVSLVAVLVGGVSIGLLAISKALHLFPLAMVHALSAATILWGVQFPLGRTLTLIFSDVMALLFGMIFALIILRLVTYLRDRERASYFAVYDLVELIRKLDTEIWEQGGKLDHWQLASNLNPEESGRRRVELNIMAHSLGCMVVTNAIRILSDVFDPDAVHKTPNSSLGRTLSLERLVLVAPDIPIESVLPGRSNFLTSTLGRCREPYVFTNEGDLALRLASTAVNYIGYFSRTRFGGYRLGNITCTRGSSPIQYGIINADRNYPPHQNLDVRSSSREQKTLVDLYQEREHAQDMSWQNAIADKITYFDCTDYRDTKRQGDNNTVPIVTQAKQRTVLNFLDYCVLVVKYLILGQIDTHGGYFEGQLSRELLHELLLSGFHQYLEGHHNGSLEKFNQAISQKQIQMVVSHQFAKRFCLTRPTRIH